MNERELEERRGTGR